MPSIQLFQFFVIDLDERQVKGGSLSQARSIALGDGEVSDQTYKIAPETAVKLFDAIENESLGSFDFCWIESDRDVLIQLTTGVGVTDAYDVKTLRGSGTAGQPGPALVLGSNVTQLLDGTVDAFDGSADTVGEIWAYNESSTETARVRLVIGT
ncbi:MAG: hypothetical protein KKD77_23850 [Gammaproteobacteria bacterium]|nr:hypothetical protein [Gammaproteobacteria bacterium]